MKSVSYLVSIPPPLLVSTLETLHGSIRTKNALINEQLHVRQEQKQRTKSNVQEIIFPHKHRKQMIIKYCDIKIRYTNILMLVTRSYLVKHVCSNLLKQLPKKDQLLRIYSLNTVR